MHSVIIIASNEKGENRVISRDGLCHEGGNLLRTVRSIARV